MTRLDPWDLLRRMSPLVAASTLFVGCASSPRPTLPEVPSGEAPWTLPTASFPTQRLYRVKYRGPEGDLAFKLTLYLQDRERYQMRAVARFGRRLWSLSIGANNEALWLDHYQKEYCRTEDAKTLTLVPLAHLPLSALPKFLLGRLPAEPAAGAGANQPRSSGRLAYNDVQGQSWTGELAAGRLRWWSLSDSGEAVASWRSEGRGGIFADRRGEQEVRWQEVLSEPLTVELEPVEIPTKYKPAVCDEWVREASSPSSTRAP